jgi:hypothetical protein
MLASLSPTNYNIRFRREQSVCHTAFGHLPAGACAQLIAFLTAFSQDAIDWHLPPFAAAQSILIVAQSVLIGR